jgi:hypothetical protein
VVIRFSVFQSLFDTEPRPLALPLDAFGRYITAPRKLKGAADKQAAPGWSPSTFKGRRKNSNVVETSCICLDFDDGVTLREARNRFRQFHSIFNTSWSHTPEHHRFRLILPLSRPVSREEFSQAWASRLCGGKLDKSCKDPARFWYLPATHHRVPRHEHFWARVFPGEIANVTRILADVPPPAPRRPVTRKQSPRNTSLDEANRRILGERLGRCNGMSASKITCPACGDASVYFYFSGGFALCNHRNSCDWQGPVEDLP